MELFSNSLELSRFVFVIGAFLALLYKRKSGITPGGIIVPAFLALILDQSFTWFITLLLTAAATQGLYRISIASIALSKHWVVFWNIAISVLLVLLVKATIFSDYLTTELVLFGVALPGLIAANARHYGAHRVYFGTLLVTAGTVLAGMLLSKLIPFGYATELTVHLSVYKTLTIENTFPMIIATLLTGAILYKKLNVRTGGYILAPFVALLAYTSPIEFILFLLFTAIGYFLVQLVLKYSLITGLERFVLSLIISASFVTFIDILGASNIVPFYVASSMILVVAMGVYINDLCLQKPSIKMMAGLSAPVFVALFLSIVGGII